MTDNSLSSTRPYLIRAMHEWMTDNNQTPLVVVDAVVDGVIVPLEHVKEGRIVLNIAWSATRDLELGNDVISFQARFGGARTFGCYTHRGGAGYLCPRVGARYGLSG